MYGGRPIFSGELNKEDKTMTKSDLRSGHIVTYRNGDKRKVFLNTCFGEDLLVSRDGWIPLSVFDENLTYEKRHDLDIVKVEAPRVEVDCGMENPLTRTIWERPTKKQYTYAQLKEILGEEFEIVKE